MWDSGFCRWIKDLFKVIRALFRLGIQLVKNCEDLVCMVVSFTRKLTKRKLCVKGQAKIAKVYILQ